MIGIPQLKVPKNYKKVFIYPSFILSSRYKYLVYIKWAANKIIDNKSVNKIMIMFWMCKENPSFGLILVFSYAELYPYFYSYNV